MVTREQRMDRDSVFIARQLQHVVDAAQCLIWSAEGAQDADTWIDVVEELAGAQAALWKIVVATSKALEALEEHQ